MLATIRSRHWLPQTESVHKTHFRRHILNAFQVKSTSPTRLNHNSNYTIAILSHSHHANISHSRNEFSHFIVSFFAFMFTLFSAFRRRGTFYWLSSRIPSTSQDILINLPTDCRKSTVLLTFVCKFAFLLRFFMFCVYVHSLFVT